MDDNGVEEVLMGQDQLVVGKLPPPNSQSMVPNLNITITEVDLIL